MAPNWPPRARHSRVATCRSKAKLVPASLWPKYGARRFQMAPSWPTPAREPRMHAPTPAGVPRNLQNAPAQGLPRHAVDAVLHGPTGEGPRTPQGVAGVICVVSCLAAPGRRGAFGLHKLFQHGRDSLADKYAEGSFEAQGESLARHCQKVHTQDFVDQLLICLELGDAN